MVSSEKYQATLSEVLLAWDLKALTDAIDVIEFLEDLEREQIKKHDRS